MAIKANWKDVAAGSLFIIIGGFFTIDAMMHLPMGSAVSMGPGYFPRILGIVLILMGLSIAGTAIGKEHEAIGSIPWRGMGLVILSIIFFGATIRGLGMLVSLSISTYFAGMSSFKLTHLGAAFTSAIISVVSVIIFIVLIKLPYPIVGPWITGLLG